MQKLVSRWSEKQLFLTFPCGCEQEDAGHRLDAPPPRRAGESWEMLHPTFRLDQDARLEVITV